MRYVMVIDLHLCFGCHSCSVACKAEWGVPADQQRSWVKRLGPNNTPFGMAYTFYPGQCNHCDKAVCVEPCPVEKKALSLQDSISGISTTIQAAATWKNPLNGLVEIDPKRCIGCGACVDACPYEARYLKPSGTDALVADKCNFCAPRVAEGMEPACVSACPAGARFFGDADDPDSTVARLIEEGAVPLTSFEVRIGPNVYYSGVEKDLFLLKSCCAPQPVKPANPRRQFLFQSARVLSRTRV